MTQQASWGNEDPKTWLDPKCFCARFDEQWKRGEEYDRLMLRGVRLAWSAEGGGELSESCLLFVQILLGLSSSLETRMLLSFRCRKGGSHMSILWPVSGRRAGRRSEWPSCFRRYLKLLQPKILNMPMYHISGQCVLNSTGEKPLSIDLAFPIRKIFQG